jgi:hypothetical protein
MHITDMLMHTPPMQASPIAQRRPHMLQLAGSNITLLQVPLQLVRPGSH